VAALLLLLRPSAFRRKKEAGAEKKDKGLQQQQQRSMLLNHGEWGMSPCFTSLCGWRPARGAVAFTMFDGKIEHLEKDIILTFKVRQFWISAN
jgi:hypothetical protein